MYRMAILGCGRIAQAHANAYRGREDVAIVASAEVDPERARVFAEKNDIPHVYSDYQELLDREKPDIVSVCTWPPLHAEMTVAAAQAGARAVHCEKPMAVSLGEARAMVQATNESGSKLIIGHQHRWDANVNRAKTLVAEGAIGSLQWIYGYCGSRDLLSNGTHVVDLIRYLLDDAPVRAVMGQIDRPAPRIDFGHEVEHGAIAHLYFDNGMRAFVEQGENAPPPYAFQLVGTEGFITLNAPEGFTIRVINTMGEQPVELVPVNSKRAEVDALLAWIEGGPPHTARGENGLLTHEVLMAIYESSRRHGAIRLPFDGDEHPLMKMIAEGDVP